MSITKTEAAERAHYLLAINDPDFYKDLSAATDKDEALKRYGLTREYTMVDIKTAKLLKDGFFPIIGGFFKFDDTSNRFIVFLNTNVKKQDVQGLWGNIQTYRKTYGVDKQPKLKSPDDPELLYAIFKARVRGHTFPQIFDMYRSGTLLSYENKPTNNFSTEFDIKKYYSKYYNPI
jgi:hypothetical protein